VSARSHHIIININNINNINIQFNNTRSVSNTQHSSFDLFSSQRGSSRFFALLLTSLPFWRSVSRERTVCRLGAHPDGEFQTPYSLPLVSTQAHHVWIASRIDDRTARWPRSGAQELVLLDDLLPGLLEMPL
jgi:hypothetical protein